VTHQLPDGNSPSFPGGTSVSHLSVYEWQAGDGHLGGSAHAHLTCTEGYVVVAGTGRLQTLSGAGFAETSLQPMSVVWFSPGVIHRLINDGNLQLLVVMQNSGLPESGDAVMTFPAEYLADPARYYEVASLAQGAAARQCSEAAAAEHRQNLSVEGFSELRRAVERDGPGALDDFYRAGLALLRDRVPGWREIWSAGALAEAERTRQHLDAVADGNPDHLHQGRLSIPPLPSPPSFGMCGRLLRLVDADSASRRGSHAGDRPL
jgi:mannose-6-phosphate isomerase-like protein (cupin superfamily)